MKSSRSPLVWLCAAGAIALGAFALLDPNGVYADYIAALGGGTPPVAAVFTAAREGVYPWSAASAEELSPRSPAFHALTESVTDEEMRSSVGNNEPFPEETVELTPSVEILLPAAPQSEPEKDDETGGFVTVDESWFNDALFIGDSHTEGLCDYGGMRNATFYYKRGVDVWSVMKKSFVGGKTIPQALAAEHFGKIYIMLGINEIMCGTTESFAAQYADVVAQLRELQPDALIYIQAIFHTSQKKSDTSSYNNDVINARNAAIAAIADGEQVFFVDCNAVFDDENGALTPSYTGDGVHVKAAYYSMWRDYLLQFGRPGVAVAQRVEHPAPEKPVAAPAPAPAPAPAAPVEAEPVQTDEAALDPAQALLPGAEVVEQVPPLDPTDPLPVPTLPAEPQDAAEPSGEPEAENAGEDASQGASADAEEKNIENTQNNA